MKTYNDTTYEILNKDWYQTRTGVSIRDVMRSLSLGEIGLGDVDDSGYVYIRNVYGLEYLSHSRLCRSGGISGKVLDPWNRRFIKFPEIGVLRSWEYEGVRPRYWYSGYCSLTVHRNQYDDEIKPKDAVCNVYVITTTVCGGVVYCVDILAGVYD